MRILVSINILLFGVLTVSAIQPKKRTEIQFNVPGLKDTTIKIGQYNNGVLTEFATSAIKKGKIVIKADSVWPAGVYSLFVRPDMSADFFIGAEPNIKGHLPKNIKWLNNNIIIDKNDESKGFAEFIRKMDAHVIQLGIWHKQLENVSDNGLKTKIQDSLKVISESMQKFWSQSAVMYKNTPFGTYVGSYIQFQVPENINQNYYLCNHFFDNMPLDNSLFLHVPGIDSRIFDYMDRVVVQHPDSINLYGMALFSKTNGNIEMKRALYYLLMKYTAESRIMGIEKLRINLAERALQQPEMYKLDSLHIQKLRAYIDRETPTVLDNQAPAFEVETYRGSTINLYNIEANYTVLLFWEPTCSHCAIEIPKIKELIWDKYAETGVKIFAVNVESNVDAWQKFILKHEIDKWENGMTGDKHFYVKSLYNVDVTPKIFLLDQNKRIIAKGIGAETLAEILFRLINFGHIY